MTRATALLALALMAGSTAPAQQAVAPGGHLALLARPRAFETGAVVWEADGLGQGVTMR